LLLRDKDGKPLVIDRRPANRRPFDQKGVRPDLGAEYDADGQVSLQPVFQHDGGALSG
jgi:hypothetical protein